MGKRRERRIAAAMAASRRVKLDLFAEPSGEKGSSSMHDEVGEDQNGDHNDGIPSSSSPSGKKQENPLALLGQYSDDETVDVALEEHNNVGEDSSLTKTNVKVAGDNVVGEDVNHSSDSGVTAGKNEQHADEIDKNLDVNNVMGVQEGANATSQVSVLEASGDSSKGETTGVWKILMDEQTNRCYYWNTQTGETSWDVPSGMSLGAQVQHQHVSSGNEERTDSLIDAHASANLDLAYGADGDGTSAQLGDVILNSGSANCSLQMGMEKGSESGWELLYNNKLLTNYNIHATGVLYGGSAMMPEFVASQQADVLLPNSDNTTVYTCTGAGKFNETVDDHSARLVNYGESLLQRLELVARSENKLAGYEAIRKEIEIRLFDCKALLPYRSSLVPFWWHTETQLKQLDSTIAKEEAIRVIQSEDLNELEPPAHLAPSDENFQSQVVDPGSKLVIEANDTSATVSEGDSSYMAITEDSKVSKPAGEGLGRNQQPIPSQLAAGVESHAEDMDVDVDMEVDEDTVQIDGKELINSHLLPLKEVCGASLLSSDDCIPHPPDEEWIPPPPTESEPVPPPPPEEPSELVSLPPEEPAGSSCPLEAGIPPQPYQEPYSFPYTYNYYAPTSNQVVATNYYDNTGGLHVTDPSQTAFYEAVSANPYSEVASASVNAIHQIVYYNAASIAPAPASASSSMDSSGYYFESGPINYSNNVVGLPGQSGSTETHIESDNSSVSIAKPVAVTSSVSFEGKASETKTLDAQVTETCLINGGNSNITSVPVSKNQPKVVRGKKRTVAATTLRSNKKVSGLVDKWKAAKEELHSQDVEEPEDPYELLERKRQKEVEEWHAHQISSGEAQDNANFVPLGGAWRERVKCRRQAKGDIVQSPPQESVEKDKKQPDLVELSKDLPPGWQAYWDETSRDVYYGNKSTSETTWIRPSR